MEIFEDLDHANNLRLFVTDIGHVLFPGLQYQSATVLLIFIDDVLLQNVVHSKRLLTGLVHLALDPAELTLMRLKQLVDCVCVLLGAPLEISNFEHAFTCNLGEHIVHIVSVNIEVYIVFLLRLETVSR